MHPVRHESLDSAVGLLNEGVQWLAQTVHDKTDVSQMLMIEDVPAVEAESRLVHAGVYPLEVEFFELVPLGEDGDAMGVGTRAVGVRMEGHALSCGWLGLGLMGVVPLKFWCRKVLQHLSLRSLRIKDLQLCPIICQALPGSKL